MTEYPQQRRQCAECREFVRPSKAQDHSSGCSVAQLLREVAEKGP